SDAGPVLKISFEIRRINAAIFGWQARDGTLQVADTGQVLFYASFVVARQLLLQCCSVGQNRIENAAFPVDPTFFLRTEETIEEPVRNHLRRQRTLVARPTHIALHAFAERF